MSQYAEGGSSTSPQGVLHRSYKRHCRQYRAQDQQGIFLQVYIHILFKTFRLTYKTYINYFFVGIVIVV